MNQTTKNTEKQENIQQNTENRSKLTCKEQKQNEQTLQHDGITSEQCKTTRGDNDAKMKQQKPGVTPNFEEQN